LLLDGILLAMPIIVVISLAMPIAMSQSKFKHQPVCDGRVQL